MPTGTRFETPSSVYALWTRSISFREPSPSREALQEQVRNLGEHISKLGRNLKPTVKAYNGTMEPLESQVLLGPRRSKELGAGTGEEIDPSTGATHPPTAPTPLTPDRSMPTPGWQQ